MKQLRRRFGSRTFNISGDIKVANVFAHYYSTLKEVHVDHLSYQKGTYWTLSPDVSLFIFYGGCLLFKGARLW